MFIILLTYKKPIEIVDQYLSQHIEFLDKGYRSNCFVVSGRRNPRTGGVIISQLKNRDQLEKLMQSDPYFINAVADFEIIEFTPRAHHPDFACFIE